MDHQVGYGQYQEAIGQDETEVDATPELVGRGQCCQVPPAGTTAFQHPPPGHERDGQHEAWEHLHMAEMPDLVDPERIDERTAGGHHGSGPPAAERDESPPVVQGEQHEDPELERIFPVPAETAERVIDRCGAQQVVRPRDHVLFRMHERSVPEALHAPSDVLVEVFQHVVVETRIAKVTGNERVIGVQQGIGKGPHAPEKKCDRDDRPPDPAG